MKKVTFAGGLISAPASQIIDENYRPWRIGIAGVRFQSGGDGKGDGKGDAGAGDGKGDTTLAGGAGDGKGDAGAGKGDGKGDGKGAGEGKGKGDGKGDGKGAGDGKGSNDGTGKAGDEGQPKAPDKYELKVPTGAQLGDADLKYIEEIARKNDWTNDEAQAELDAQIDLEQSRVAERTARYLIETKGDADFGGAKLDETTQLARKAVNTIFPEGHRLREAFLQDLNGSGIGNKLTVVAFLATVGKHFSEDVGTGGRAESEKPQKKADADVLFPSSAAKA
jgi:hypothetical protein